MPPPGQVRRLGDYELLEEIESDGHGSRSRVANGQPAPRADVDAVAPLVGRGGLTWYSGSVGWLYRAGLEAVLGFNVRGDHVLIDPCIPKAWPGFSIEYRYRSSRYIIEIENPHGVSRGIAKIELDGVAVTGIPTLTSGAPVPLNDDGAEHRVHIVLG